jgi:uncharacterized membrane protein AbrB (regulator of aidB expression)
VARLAVPGGAPLPAIDWFPPVEPVAFAQTVALIVVAIVVATLLRMPVGAIFFTMILGVLLQNLAGLRIELPPVLLATAFTLIGWSIGLRFTRDILLHAWRARPAGPSHSCSSGWRASIRSRRISRRARAARIRWRSLQPTAQWMCRS